MPLYEYECGKCGEWTEAVFPIAERPESIRCDCGARAAWRISTPALHTLDTFTREIRDPVVQRSRQCDGSYIDPNLSHNKDGTWTPITSPAHRRELMKQKGLYEHEPDEMCREVDRDKRRQPKSFSWN